MEKLTSENIDLSDNVAFDGVVKNLCDSLESQCLSEHSIEEAHIARAIEVNMNVLWRSNTT